jgi:hypothetical protein
VQAPQSQFAVKPEKIEESFGRRNNGAFDNLVVEQKPDAIADLKFHVKSAPAIG